MSNSDENPQDESARDPTTESAEVLHKRSVRSYVIRGGRLTPSQQHALEHYWPKYGITATDTLLDVQQVFGRTAPLVLEIGFGMGQSLVAMALAHPEQNFIGVDVHKPGVGKLLDEIEKNQLTNVRLFCCDAKEVVQHCLAENALDVIQIFFPDPWHKKRHFKRRLIQPEFVAMLSGRLKSGGLLHLATDWQPYAEQMMEVLSAEPTLINQAGAQFYSDSSRRETTRFEQRGQRLGHGVWDLQFVKR